MQPARPAISAQSAAPGSTARAEPEDDCGSERLVGTTGSAHHHRRLQVPALPADMWREILGLLDAPALMACRQTSRQLSALGRSADLVGLRRQLHHQLAQPRVFGRIQGPALEFALDVLEQMSAVRLGQPGAQEQNRRCGRMLFEAIATQTPRARQIEVYSVPLGYAAAPALAARPADWPLTSLALDACQLTAQRLPALLGAPCLHNLQELNLDDNSIGDEGAEQIAGLSSLSSLTSLSLDANGLTGRGLTALCTSVHLLGLRSLMLEDNPLDTLAPLPQLPHLPQLDSLYLAGTRLATQGLHELFKAFFVPHLAILKLDDSPLGALGADAIARAANLDALAILQLNNCRLGDHGAWRIAESGHLSTLLTLEMADNQIGDEGAFALSESPHLANLEQLDLCNNSIGAAGALCIASGAFIGAQLQALHLGRNPLDEDAFVAAIEDPCFDRSTIHFSPAHGSSQRSNNSYQSFLAPR